MISFNIIITIIIISSIIIIRESALGRSWQGKHCGDPGRTPNLPTNIIPTNIAWLKLSGKLPMGLGIPPLLMNIGRSAHRVP